MAATLRDAISPHVKATGSTYLPRILGLTASIIHGNLQNMQQKRKALEVLMNSTIICPNVSSKLELKRYHHIMYQQDPSHARRKAEIDMHVINVLNNTRQIKEVKKVVLRCSHVFCELGTTSMFYYIDELILQQIEDKATHLELQNEQHCSYAARGLRACLTTLREDLRQVSESLSSANSWPATMLRTPKLNRLLELLDVNFALNGCTEYRGIIFVEQVALVSALAKQINDEFNSRFRCGAIAGTGAQTEYSRQEQLEAFKHGQLQVLVATATLEEGIDVTKCKFVVRYNHIATTKGHIQGAGRARHPEAEIYYLENCPKNECRKEAAMTAVARSDSQLSEGDLQKAFIDTRKTVDRRHPYPFGSSCGSVGEVNVFNCKQLLVTYCSRVLGKSINPTVELYDYVEASHSDNSGNMLSSIRYPTPDGWQMKTCSHYLSFWSGVDLGKEVFCSDRVKNKTQSEKEETCFVYLVVVELRQKGLLDKNSKPTEACRFETQRKCPLRGGKHPSGIALKDSVVQSIRCKNSESEGEDELAHQEPTEESVDDENAIESLYPLTDTKGESVTQETCKNILNEYITIVLGKSLPFKKELFEYENIGQQRTILLNVRLPTPSGWL